MLIVFVRAILLYLLVIFALRLMGKRQLGELQPTELVITILISNIASLPIEDPSIPMIMGAIPILVLVGFELLVSQLSLKNRKFRKFISGNPVVVIRGGTIDQQALKKLRFSTDDLMESLREQNIFDLKDVNFAIVETTGKVSIQPTFEAQNLTPGIMGIQGSSNDPPILIISDGMVIPAALRRYGLSMGWLNRKLKENHCRSDQVFLMTATREGEIHLVLYESQKQSKS